MKEPVDIEQWRRAWAESEAGLASEADALRVLDAVSLELPPEELRALLDRARSDPALAETWRLARAFAAAEAQSTARTTEAHPTGVESVTFQSTGATPLEERRSPSVIRGPAHWFRRLALPSAGLVAAAAGLLLSLREPVGPAVWRGGEEPVIEAISREELDILHPRLAWKGPVTAVWSLRVSTVDLVVLIERHGLTEPSCTLDPTLLRDLPDGTLLHWQVEGQLPSGEQIRSETFTLRTRR